MKRLIEKMVCLGLVTAWRLATWPTRRSPSLVKATTDGVVRPPSALGMTTGSPPSMTATTELVVPRSMPMILEAMSTPVEMLKGLEPAAADLPAAADARPGGNGIPGKAAIMADKTPRDTGHDGGTAGLRMYRVRRGGCQTGGSNPRRRQCCGRSS